MSDLYLWFYFPNGKMTNYIQKVSKLYNANLKKKRISDKFKFLLPLIINPIFSEYDFVFWSMVYINLITYQLYQFFFFEGKQPEFILILL